MTHITENRRHGSEAAPRERTRTTRKSADERALARIRIAATIIRHRQETLYDRFAERFRAAYDEGTERGREAMDAAAEKARDQLTAAGAFSQAQGRRLKDLLLRDLDHAAADVRAAGRTVAEHLDPSRLEAGALASIARVLDGAGDRLHDFAHRADKALAYRTGEVTSAGTLSCTRCKTKLTFVKTGTVPPCPSCAATDFRKSY